MSSEQVRNKVKETIKLFESLAQLNSEHQVVISKPIPKIKFDTLRVPGISTSLDTIHRSHFNSDSFKIITDLISTERSYVNNLNINEKTLQKIERKDKHVEAFLVSMLCLHQSSNIFLTNLEKGNCGNLIDTARIFNEHEHLFESYLKCITCEHYLRTKTNVFHNIKDVAMKAYLISPLQRLTKYKCLLLDMQNICEKYNKTSSEIIKALEMVKQVMRKSDNKIAIQSIVGLPKLVRNYGKLIFRHEFRCVTAKNKKYMLFLFNAFLLLTICKQNKLMYDKMYLKTSMKSGTHKNRLILSYKESSKTMIFECESRETVEKWHKALTENLE